MRVINWLLVLQYAAMGWEISSLFLTKCLCDVWMGSKGGSCQGIQMSSPCAFWVLDQGRWRLHALLLDVDSAMFANVAWQVLSNFQLSWVVGNNSPMRNWPKKARQQIAQMQLSKPEDWSSAQLISVSIGIVTGALLGWYEDTSLNSLIPFIIRHNCLLPCHSKPLYWCSLFIAKVFAPMVFPTSGPAYVEAQAISMSSLAGRILSSWIPSPLQKEIYSHNLPKTLVQVVLLRAESCNNFIFSCNIVGRTNLRLNRCRSGCGVQVVYGWQQ